MRTRINRLMFGLREFRDSSNAPNSLDKQPRARGFVCVRHRCGRSGWHTGVVEHRKDPIEARTDELHRRVASRIRSDPSIVAIARERLARWIAQDGPQPLPSRLEWSAALRFLE